MFIKNTVLVTFFATLSICADILGIIPAPSYGHQVIFFDLWSELSLRGHKVTVITADTQKNASLTNLTEIDMNWTYKFLKNLSSDVQTMTMWNFHPWFYHQGRTISQGYFSDHKVQELIHNKKHFDVVLVESVYPEFLGFAEIYDCPAILVSSLDVFTIFHHKMGNPVHPALTPIKISKFFPPLNFEERVINTIYTLYSTWFYRYVDYPDRSKIIQRTFNITSTMDDLLDRVDVLFYNVNPVSHSVRALGPTTIDISGMSRISAEPLPKDLKEFLDSATKGFVYFNLGGAVTSKDFPKRSLKSITDTISDLPYKVLWKFEAEPEIIQNTPDNLKLIKWAPQTGILAHPNIKGFITQGGIQSIGEAIHYEVPCVVIPFIAYQEQNAKMMVNKGYARLVQNRPHIKKKKLKAAILDVVNNPKYKNAAKVLKRLASDTPMTGLEKAIWWTEYVIRNKGAKHLRDPVVDLPLYQYYLLDVIGFLLTVAVVTLTVFFILLKKTYTVLRTNLVNSSGLLGKKLK